MLEIVEHKAATPEQRAIREINSGILCFDADSLWKHIHELRPDNPAREYYLTDMVAILNRAGAAGGGAEDSGFERTAGH